MSVYYVILNRSYPLIGMAKRKAEYIEGRKARENFKEAIRYAFSIPKERAPAKPKPKHRKASGSDKG